MVGFRRALMSMRKHVDQGDLLQVRLRSEVALQKFIPEIRIQAISLLKGSHLLNFCGQMPGFALKITVHGLSPDLLSRGPQQCDVAALHPHRPKSSAPCGIA